MQIKSIREQTVKPTQIWLWVNHHADNEHVDFSDLDIDRIFKHDFNWKCYGKFSAALLADTEFVALYDDDTIPGKKWHENCLQTMQTHEGILGTYGITLKNDSYMDHNLCGWKTKNTETTEVDIVSQGCFFKRKWLRYLWQEKPVIWDNGAEIQFSFMAKTYGNIPTFCPPHPPEDTMLHGSLLACELGIDSKAVSCGNEVSLQQFFAEKNLCVRQGLSNGWCTIHHVVVEN